MSEIKQIAVLVIVTLVIGIIGLVAVLTIPPLLQGDLVASSYDAMLYSNGTLHETYTYNVGTSGEYPDALPEAGSAPDIFLCHSVVHRA